MLFRSAMECGTISVDHLQEKDMEDSMGIGPVGHMAREKQQNFQPKHEITSHTGRRNNRGYKEMDTKLLS